MFDNNLISRVETEEARDAIRIADEISDMILFHRRVRKNGDAMRIPWEDDDEVEREV